MTRDPPRYWFPAKRYGWGWGPPATWQGWLVLVAGALAELGLALRLLPGDPAGFGLGTLVLVLGLIVVCYWKGEPPGWRWGDKDA